MGKKQICAVIMGVMMLAGAAAGCGSTAAQVKETVAASGNAASAEETAAVAEKAAPAEDTEAQTDKMRQKDGESDVRRPENGGTIIQVTAIDGDTITGEIGELRPGKPDGAPDHPDRDDRKQPGDGRRGPDGGPRGGEFTATEGTMTFTVTDDTVIVTERVKDSEDTTAAELAVGDVLEVVADDNGQAVTVTVKYTGN